MATRPSSTALGTHVAAGALVLVLASAFVGFRGYFFIDEAALYGQLEVMDDTGDWTVPLPFPDRDPDGTYMPMARSDVADGRFAPFAKHPVHVLVARGAHLIGGDVAVRLLSSVGLLCAGVGAAVISGREPRRRVLAFWITLVASPLLFDANLVVAHTLGAAVAAAVVAIVVRVPDRRWSIPTVLLLTCLGGLLRNEFLLLGAAGFVVLGVRSLLRRSIRDALLGASMFVGSVAAYLGEPLLVRSIIGGRPGLDQAPTSGTSVSAAAEATVRALFEVEGLPGTTAGLLGVVVAGSLTGVAAVVIQRRAVDRGLVVVVAAAALAGSLLFVLQPHLVTGLVWAFPALLLLVALVSRSAGPDGPLRLPVVMAGVFALLVAATQYSQGGGLEWGWRYVAVAVPLVTPAIADVATRWWDRGPEIPRVALGALAAACAFVQVGGLRVERTVVSDTRFFLDQVGDVAADADADWVLSLDASFGRFAYPLSVQGQVATAADGTGSEVLGWLADDEVPTVLVVWRFGEELPLEDLAGYRTSGAVQYLASAYRAALLVR